MIIFSLTLTQTLILHPHPPPPAVLLAVPPPLLHLLAYPPSAPGLFDPSAIKRDVGDNWALKLNNLKKVGVFDRNASPAPSW